MTELSLRDQSNTVLPILFNCAFEYSSLNWQFSESGNEQALYQFYGFLVTVAISLSSGTLTGLLMRLSIWDQVEPRKYFDDMANWEVEKLLDADDQTNL